jgi:hypothetical protein
MFGGTTPVSQNNDLWCFSIPYTNNPPIALCKEVAVSTDANTCTAVASIDNGSSDPDGDQITLIQTPPGPYTVGTTNVTLTVTDNQGESSSCTGIVTVVDDKAPVVRTQDPTVTLINGIATITASDVDNGSSDNCGIASMTVSPNSFNCTSTGDQTVILTVTDVNGNVTTETARVLVLGETPSVSIDVNPEYTIWGEEPYTIYLGYGAQSITLTVLGGISYSWSSNPTGTISNSQSITVSPTVTTEYFVTVTNQYGCSDSKSIEINVVDWRCGNGDHKIRICHNGHVICVDTHAVAAHMEHGDNIGDCRSYKDTYEEAETLSSGGDEFTVKLKQNSPNPFNYMTEIQYFVSQREHVSLILTDITGKVVANLIDSYVPPSWNTLIINGSGLTPGVYLVRIESQGKSDMMKIVKTE